MGFDLFFKAPLQNFPSGDIIKDITLMNKTLEDFILVSPEQYLWVHRRFKKRPEGEPPFYS